MHSNTDTMFPDHHWVVVPFGAVHGHLMHIVLAPKHITTPQAAFEWRTRATKPPQPYILVVHEPVQRERWWSLYLRNATEWRHHPIVVDDVPEPYREQLQVLMALES